MDLTNGPPNRLVAQTTNTGTYTWSVPTDLDPSAEYRLSVKATADDGTFPTALIDPLTFVSAGSLTASAAASAESAPEELAGAATGRAGAPAMNYLWRRSSSFFIYSFFYIYNNVIVSARAGTKPEEVGGRFSCLPLLQESAVFEEAAPP